MITMENGNSSRWSCIPLKGLKRSSWSRSVSRLFGRNHSQPKMGKEKRLSDSLSSDRNSSTDIGHATPAAMNKPDLDRYSELSSRICAIISRYKLPSKAEITQQPRARLLAQVHAQVSRSQPVEMCLPAFPFKSPNTSSKVLGDLPDKAEEFAFAHLNGMCAAIAHIYKPGAKLMIISDGLVYNGQSLPSTASYNFSRLTFLDLLGVPDKTVWAYGESLRSIATENDFKYIQFSRLKDLAKLDVPEKLDQITYIANATNFRHALLSQYSDPKFDASFKIHNDENTCLTYRGYIKFLVTDLQDVYPVGSQRTKGEYKRGTEYIAKQMLFRGDVSHTNSAFSSH